MRNFSALRQTAGLEEVLTLMIFFPRIQTFTFSRGAESAERKEAKEPGDLDDQGAKIPAFLRDTEATGSGEPMNSWSPNEKR